MENHERVERELLEQCGQIATLMECFAWLQRCDEYIEQFRRTLSCQVFMPRHWTIRGGEDRATRGCAMINSNHIEPRRFLDAGNVVLERVRDAVERHGSVKVNTAFNEFATKEKRANKCIIIKNSKLYHCTNMRE
ncbi:hypothetical protein G5I_02933 [Acromyrmex echinatior]|uniref:Uncharacterized protein n=1 Tax=Acromyrmex echinatior TaxID=103372 RepID=F4WBL4_ACREC|nr:hypothetical protein G5I_02933 [Acromyrmex echinatior]